MRKFFNAATALQVTVLGVLFVLICIPVLLIIFAALSDVLPRPGNISLTNLTFETIGGILSGATLGAAQNSLIIAFGSALFAMFTGGALAFIFARTDIKWKPFVYLAGLAPMFIPAFVAALAWSILGNPRSGLLNVLARDLGLPEVLNVYSFAGLIFVLGVYYAPYVFLFTSSALLLMNPELEEAGRVHGAKQGTVIRRVTMGLMTPPLLGSGFLVFILSLENFPVAQFLANPSGINTLPTYIYRFMNSSPQRGNEAAAVALLLIGVVLLLTYIQQRILRRRNYTIVGGKGARASLVRLGRARTPLFAGVIAFFVVSIVLPMSALILTATSPSAFIPSVTGLLSQADFNISALWAPFERPQVTQAATNSVIVSVGVGVLATALCFISAYLVLRMRQPGSPLIEYMAMTPLAIPAIVLGMGLLWTWLIMPLPVYGTLAIMVIAFIAVQMPQGYRGMSSSLLQQNTELEESAMMHGATRVKSVRKITIPLMKEGIASVFILMLMLSMRELTVPLFLYTTDTRILSIVIFDEYENGAIRSASALSVIYVGIIAALALLARRFGFSNLR
ncbi:ABC transporter permease [Nesterenkonia ebinurensis]|uniref:ABC transporter permease n=1 Tax=Nesterenkonia ebinurensis TaxID=2608252 RepID=UPI00123D51ED|nr:iron ABC transporter permease [Nesterenkonia ebinurensis]